MNSIGDLPDEVLIIILEFLPVKSHGQVFQVSSDFYTLSSRDDLWEDLCRVYFPDCVEKKRDNDEKISGFQVFFKETYNRLRSVDGFQIPNFTIPLLENPCTKYIGWERLERLDQIQEGMIRVYHPYAYIVSENFCNKASKDLTNQWFRVHGGTGNHNGILAAEHLCLIMKWEFKKCDSGNKKFPKDAQEKLRMMYFSAYKSDYNHKEIDKLNPKCYLNYCVKGGSSNALEFFEAIDMNSLRK